MILSKPGPNPTGSSWAVLRTQLIPARGRKPAYALIDGNRMPPLDIPGETVVKGDAKSASIAAASILAKVSRDRVMKLMDEVYPQYQFAKHKGYGTKVHTEMLRTYGPCPIHRKTFLTKILGKGHE